MKDENKTKNQLITELTQLRQRLEKTESLQNDKTSVEERLRLYENIVSVTKDRLAYVDRNYIYKAVNVSYCRACNRKREEVLGRTMAEVLGSDVFDSFIRRHIDRCFKGESVRYQAWFQSPVTGKNYLDVQYQPFFNSDGQVEGVVVSSRDITDHKYAGDLRIKEASAKARSEELKRSRQKIVMAQEAERKNLAQQLHGKVQTKIILILHKLGEVKKLITDSAIAEKLGEVSQEIENLLEVDIRSLSYQLYPSILRQGLVPAFQSLCDQFEPRLSIKIEVDENLLAQEQARHGVIPEIVKLTAYRIVEESLNNIIKHSEAKNVIIKLEYSKGRWLRVIVKDTGRGYDPAKTPSGLGTAIIQSHVDVIGGKCVTESSPGKGTVITATLPLAARKYKQEEF